MTRTIGPDQKDIDATLDAIVRSASFGASQQLRRLLGYLVSETRAGNAAALKAYTIGIDALGKPEDFDPGTDASVRVTIGRLRTALDDFYASDAAADVKVKIDIPKGRYVPVYTKREPDAQPLETWKQPRFVILMAGALSVFAAVLFAVYWRAVPEAAATLPDLPVVDIEPTAQVANPETSLVANGIREQLLADLSHFKSIRVRDTSLLPEEAGTQSAFQRGDYVLTSSVRLDQNSMLLRLAAADRSVLWADAIDLPNSDTEYYDLLRTTVGMIAVQIAGERGVVSNDMYQRLEQRVSRLGGQDTSEYRCLVLAYAFDAAKDEQIRQRARDCLRGLVSGGSDNSSVFAEYALVLFLDWAREGGGDPDHPLIQEALTNARKSVQMDAFNSVGFEHLGSILSALGERQKSIQAYQNGLELTPWKPSLNFLLGWQIVLDGDWERGMEIANRGVEMSPYAPGYMRIPGALDAFRVGNYQESYEIAQTVVQLGDARGYVLSYVAALAMQNSALAATVLDAAQTANAIDLVDPMAEVRNSFSNPSVIVDYEKVLKERDL